MSKLFGVMALAATISVAAFGYAFETSPNPSPTFLPLAKGELEGVIYADKFLDMPRFRLSDAVAGEKISGRLIAGVVNHHVLASDLEARFFKSLRLSHPDLKRIIIISPDHFKQGNYALGFGSASYKTDGKIIPTDKSMVLAVQKKIPEFEGRLLEKEHGVGALIPFMAREFGDVSILPIAVRADASRSELIMLGKVLATLMDGQTAVVVSADMSHYLSEERALKNDEATLSWFSQNNAEALFQASDDFIDSGTSMFALFAMFEELKIKPQFALLDHSISTRYGASRDNTTSYITGFWITK